MALHDLRLAGARYLAIGVAAAFTIVLGAGLALKAPSAGLPLPILSVAIALPAWLVLTKRTGLALAIVLLYLGLLDGVVKLHSGGKAATLGRDVVIYAVAAGMVLRAPRPFRLPPMSGWVLAWLAVIVVQLGNPGDVSLSHAVVSLRQHLEFIPLFFIGYSALRTRTALHIFFALLLVIATINGAVAYYQHSIGPARLASWGPGYAQILTGTGAQTYYAANGQEEVRPPGLGGYEGFGGLIGVAALPGGIVLLIAYRRRRWLLALIILGLIGCAVAVLTSQSRSDVIMAVLTLFGMIGLIAAGGQAGRALVTLGITVVLAGAAVLFLTAEDPGALYRYSSIAPGKATSTIYGSRAGTWSLLPQYAKEIPFGAGLGTVGPAANKAGGTLSTWNAESELNFLMVEAGIPAVLVFLAFEVALFRLVFSGLKRERDPEAALLIAGLAAPLFGWAGAAAFGTTTVEPPDAAMLWLAAGALSWWLITRHRELAYERVRAEPRRRLAFNLVPVPAPAPLVPEPLPPALPYAPTVRVLPAPTPRESDPEFGLERPVFAEPGLAEGAFPAPIDRDGEGVLSDEEIAASATRGALASVTRGSAGLVVQAVSSLVVAHFVLPRGYGIFGLALTIVGALRFIGDLGITFRLEALRRAGEEDISQSLAVGMLTALLGGVLVSVIWQVLPVVASGPPGSRLVAPIFALTLLIAAPTRPATAILNRRLRFHKVANATLFSTLALFAVQVVLLLAGWGMWGMVIGYVVGSIVQSAYLLRAVGGLPRPALHRPIWPVIRESAPYQGPLVAMAAVGTVVPLIVSWELGARGVGYLAWSTILASPIVIIIITIQGVVYPSLARMLRDDGSQFGEATSVVLLTFAALAAAAAGALVGLIPPLIHLVFGDRWLPAAGAVRMALLGVIPTSIVAGCSSVLYSQNKPKQRLRACYAATATAIVLTVPASVLAGVTGAAAVQYVIAPIAEVLVLAPAIGASLPDLLVRIGRIALPLAGVSVVLGGTTTSLLGLAAAAVAVAVAVAVVLAVAERDLVLSLYRKVRPQPAPVRSRAAVVAG
jgi:O-antigen/teichoic acid export membrane protein